MATGQYNVVREYYVVLHSQSMQNTEQYGTTDATAEYGQTTSIYRPHG